MELLIILLVVIVGVFIIYKMMFKDTPSTDAVSLSTTTSPVVDASSPVVNKAGTVVDSPLDVNQDGKVDVKDAVEAVKKTRARVKKAADQDGDGKLTKNDLKVVATKAKTAAKTAVAKTRGRKSTAKKA